MPLAMCLYLSSEARQAIHLLQFTGPDGQHVEVNPAGVVSLRAPRRAEHFAPGTKCIIFTSDHKYLAVMESCREVDDKLGAANHNH